MSGQVQLGEIAASVGAQLASADAALTAGQGRMRLAGLSLRLQGAAVVMDGAVGLNFDSAAGGSAVDLHFDGGSGNVDAGAPVLVPDVHGYTPAFAKRKLHAAGLGVATIAAGQRGGRVSEQQPPAAPRRSPALSCGLCCDDVCPAPGPTPRPPLGCCSVVNPIRRSISTPRPRSIPTSRRCDREC